MLFVGKKIKNRNV